MEPVFEAKTNTMLPYRLTSEVKAVLISQDLLGFDYAWQAAAAILTHYDWSVRWDFSHASAQDLLTLETWKNVVLGSLN
jgi:hypothetical protein